MDRFKGIYRIESSRLNARDYSVHRSCFVTICTNDREEYFGQVVDGEMRYNDIGTIAVRMYADIPRHNKGVTLDEFIVMPNHVHGIIVLGGNCVREGNDYNDRSNDNCRDVAPPDNAAGPAY